MKTSIVAWQLISTAMVGQTASGGGSTIEGLIPLEDSGKQREQRGHTFRPKCFKKGFITRRCVPHIFYTSASKPHTPPNLDHCSYKMAQLRQGQFKPSGAAITKCQILPHGNLCRSLVPPLHHLQTMPAYIEAGGLTFPSSTLHLLPLALTEVE